MGCIVRDTAAGRANPGRGGGAGEPMVPPCNGVLGGARRPLLVSPYPTHFPLAVGCIVRDKRIDNDTAAGRGGAGAGGVNASVSRSIHPYLFREFSNAIMNVICFIILSFWTCPDLQKLRRCVFIRRADPGLRFFGANMYVCCPNIMKNIYKTRL